MSWQRFNRTSNVFEVSDDNGASWQTLVIAASGVNVPPPSPYTAYTNVSNTFIAPQTITGSGFSEVALTDSSIPLTLRLLNYTQKLTLYEGGTLLFSVNRSGDAVIPRRLQIGGETQSFPAWRNTGAQMECVTADSALWANLKCNALETVASITCAGAVISTSVMYPGRVDVTGSQVAWYLGSHASYGLYSNTGLYANAYIWSALAMIAGTESYATDGFRERGRTPKVGEWTAFTPTITGASVTSNYGCQYTLIGKTCIITFHLIVSVPAVTAPLYLALPAGIIIGSAAISVIGVQNEWGTCHTAAGSAHLYLYRDVIGSNWSTGSKTIGGTAVFQIQ